MFTEMLNSQLMLNENRKLANQIHSAISLHLRCQINSLIRVLLIPLLFILSSCSLNDSGEILGSQLDIDLRSAKKVEFDQSAELKSEAMQRFLMAELSLDAEQTEDAFNDLRASSHLMNTPDAQIQVNLAQLYIRKGELESALKEIESIAATVDVLAMRAALLQCLGHWTDALETYRQILLLKPEVEEAQLMIALDQIQHKQNLDAQSILEKMVAKDGKHLPALKLLAFTYRELGNIDKSLSTLEYIRQLDPGDMEAFEAILSIAIEANRDEIVEKELNREARINPDSPILLGFERLNWKDPQAEARQALVSTLRANTTVIPNAFELRAQMARFALLKQNFPEAINHFSLLIANKPKDDELRYTLALALSSGGRVKEATSNLDMIDSSSPWYVRAQAFSGILYRQRGDYRRSEQAFRRALNVEPKSEQLQSYLASVLREARKFEEAKKVYHDILEQDPSNQKSLFNYGVLLNEMGQTKESLEIMQKLIGVNPQHGEALNFMAYGLAEEEKDLDRALDLANRALQIQPENGFFLDTRGWVYFKMGHIREAIIDLERSVDLTKGDAEISEHLADVYLKTGRKKEALQVYKDARDNLVDSKEPEDKISAERIRNKIEAVSKSNTNKTH